MSHPSRTEQLRDFAEDVITKSRGWAETGQDLARTGSHRVRKFVNRNPMTSTLAGLGIGYLLGKLFSRRAPSPMIPAPLARAKRALSKRS